jgi:hypothetical protein
MPTSPGLHVTAGADGAPGGGGAYCTPGHGLADGLSAAIGETAVSEIAQEIASAMTSRAIEVRRPTLIPACREEIANIL